MKVAATVLVHITTNVQDVIQLGTLTNRLALKLAQMEKPLSYHCVSPVTYANPVLQINLPVLLVLGTTIQTHPVKGVYKIVKTDTLKIH